MKAIKGSHVSSNDDIANRFTIYPNPCLNALYIDAPDMEGIVNVEFINLLGSVVKTVSTTPDRAQTGINVSDLTKGVYLVRISNGMNSYVERIVKE